jgi:hypothetical protein
MRLTAVSILRAQLAQSMPVTLILWDWGSLDIMPYPYNL